MHPELAHTMNVRRNVALIIMDLGGTVHITMYLRRAVPIVNILRPFRASFFYNRTL
jgi:sorbitol-specific phosphotransferase system component IIBC